MLNGRAITIALAGTLFFLLACATLGLEAGTEVGPERVFLAIVVLAAFSYVLVKHPAALIAPMLFAPRAKQLTMLGAFPDVGEFTELGVTAGLVAAAIFLRFLIHRNRPFLLREALADRRKEVYAYLAFVAVVSLSYLYTPAPLYGFDKLWRFWVLGSFGFFGAFFLLATEEDFRDFTLGTILFALGVAVSSFDFSHQGRLGANENIVHIGIAQLMGMALLLLFYHRFEKRAWRFLCLLICVPWLAIGLASAESRGPILGLMLALAVATFAPWWKQGFISRKQVLAILGIVVAAVLGLSAYWFRGVAASRLQSKTAELTMILEGSTEASGTATERLVYYGAALDAIPQHILRGWGIGGWSMFYWNQDDRHYPHNLFLETAVEEGLLGLAVLMVLLGSIYLTLKRNADVVSHRFPVLFPMLIYLLTVTMFSGDIDDNRFLWFWCGAVLAVIEVALRTRMASVPATEPPEPEVVKSGSPAFDRP